MAGVVFLILPLSILLVASAAIVAFLDAAFRQQALSHLAANDRHSAQATGSSPAFELVAALNGLTGTARQSDHPRCQCESFVPAVTAPEAEAIMEELHRYSQSELPQVLERARNSTGKCPMLSQTGLCACSFTRPLACIGRCVIGGDSPEWALGVGDSVSSALRQHLQMKHVDAETRRLDQALVTLMDRPRTQGNSGTDRYEQT